MDKKDMKLKPTPLMLNFYTSPMSGEEIEAESLRTIDREAPAHRFTAAQWQVVQRMIHTTADFALIEDVRFSPNAIASAIEALRAGNPLYVDSNMIRSGILEPWSQSVCPGYGPESIACYVSEWGSGRPFVQDRHAPFHFCSPKGKTDPGWGHCVVRKCPYWFARTQSFDY